MIEVRGLSTTHGRRTVLDGVSFTVEPGRVTAIAAPVTDEATAVVRAIVGLDRVRSGLVRIDGREYAAFDNPLTVVGTVLKGAPAHPGRTARDHLRWLATGAVLPARRVDDLVEMVGLGGVADLRVRDYTPAMRMRLGVAGALLGDPDHYILDNPFGALQGMDARWLRQVLRRLAARGKSVLVTGGSLAAMAATADRVLILGHGRVVTDAPAEVFRAQAKPTVVIRAQRQAELFDLLRGMGAEVAPRVGEDGVSLVVCGLTAEAVMDAAVGYGVLGMAEWDDDLEHTLGRLSGVAVPRVAALVPGGIV